MNKVTNIFSKITSRRNRLYQQLFEVLDSRLLLSGFVQWKTTIASGNWSTPSSWKDGTAPVAGDTVEFFSNATVTVNVDTPALGGILLAGATVTFDLAGNTFKGGDFDLSSGATVTIENTNGNIGILNVQNINVATTANSTETLTIVGSHTVVTATGIQVGTGVNASGYLSIINGASLIVDNAVTAGFGGEGASYVNIDSGANVSFTHDLSIGGGDNGTTVNIDGHGTTLTSGGLLAIGDDNSLEGVSFSVSEGAYVSSSDINIFNALVSIDGEDGTGNPIMPTSLETGGIFFYDNAGIQVTNGAYVLSYHPVIKTESMDTVYMNVSGFNSAWDIDEGVVMNGDGAIDGNFASTLTDIQFDPGTSSDPTGMLTLSSDLDASGGIGLQTFVDTGGQSSTLNVTGNVQFGSDPSLSNFDFSVNVSGSSFTGGATFALMIANDFYFGDNDYSYGGFSEGFSDYAFGDALPDGFGGLPSPPSGDHWSLSIATGHLYDDGSFATSYGDSLALVLSLSSSDYGGAMMARRGGGELVARGSKGDSLALALGNGEEGVGTGTGMLASPDFVEAEAIGTGGIYLSWGAVADQGVSYEIQRQTGNGSWLTVRVSPGSLTNWMDTRVKTGQAYSYRVRTIGHDGRLDSEFIALDAPVDY